VIGQAQGILMERFAMTADQAFALLARVSSHSNTKVSVLAADLVRTRGTPTVTELLRRAKL
jgi:AmiR/NasT family two-component response regulator